MEAIRNDPSMMAKLLECMQNPANMMKYLFYQYKYKWSDEWQVYEWSAYIEASEQVFLKNVPVYRWNIQIILEYYKQENTAYIL